MTSTISVTTQRPGRLPDAPPPLARKPVLTIAAALGVVLLLTSGRYGYFGDELYFLGAGKHLDWSFADQPPLLPAMAHLMDALFPNQVMGLRLPATVAVALGTLPAALLAREFGGARRAQVLSSAAYAVSLCTLWTGHLLATSTFDLVLWMLVSWLVVRWVRLHHEGVRADRLLFLAGLATAVDLQVKYLIPVFWAVLAVSVLLTGPRALLTRPLLWAGAAVAVAVSVPALVWQARHGWPQLAMGGVISSANQQSGALLSRLAIVPYVLVLAGLLTGAVLLCYGLWCLLRVPRLRPYRFVAWTALGVLLVFVVMAGRPYYVAGLFSPLWAAAAAELERREPAKWWRWAATAPAFVVTGLLSVALALPVLPVSAVDPTDGLMSNPGSVGWPNLVSKVADAYRRLPAGQQRTTVAMGEAYWQGGALDHYARQYKLPPVYSANRGYWYFGPPPADTTTVLHVTAFPERLRAFFDEVRPAASVHNPHGIPVLNSELGVYVCERPKLPWPQLWDKMKSM
ncbi:ArnT family glycosyltransferase [Streptomyces cinnamoneus]|uniref:ArnT family glycosyltransferase n=1 Tax=Streptomyces cinnamoneus TaxID=53446 RepID=UPI00378FA22A